MQGKANHKYLLFALLPLLLIAAALWGSVPKNTNAFCYKVPVNLSKAVATSQHDVPFVSDDVPQISRADYRSPLKNQAIALSSASVLYSSDFYTKYAVAFLADNYSCLFKNLYPELEFS